MVVYNDGKPIGAAIGDPPQERPVVRQLRMLAGGPGAQPCLECRLLRRLFLGAVAGGGINLRTAAPRPELSA